MQIEILGSTYPVKDKLKALGCRWDGAKKCWTAATEDMASKAKAIVSGPIYNSAPPADLGPIDAAAEAAKLGRKSVAAESVPFSRSSGKGKKHLGETFWGKNQGQRARYIVVRQGRPNYLSRDWLEDMDQFETEPGWYCDVQAVAVEPTDDEIAKDPAVAKAKAAALEARRYEIERAVQQSPQAHYPRMREQYQWDRAGMIECWGKHRSTGHSALWSDGVIRLCYETSHYDDGEVAWMLTDAVLAAEALTLADAAKKEV
jgi:hypothetical protein